MSLYLEGSVHDVEDCEFIKKLLEVLKKGKFDTKIDYHGNGNVKIQYKKEILAIVDLEVIQILESFNESSEEVWNSKFYEDRKALLEAREGENE